MTSTFDKMIQSPLGLVHTIAAVVALVIGSVIFLRPKRGRRHKQFGYIYVVSMVVVISTSLCIYRLTGKVNILHVAALVSTYALTRGLWYVLKKKPEETWFTNHYTWMVGSYLGLVAAFFAETSTRLGLPYLQSIGVRSFWWFWLIVGGVSFLVFYIGERILKAKKNNLERYNPAKVEQAVPPKSDRAGG